MPARTIMGDTELLQLREEQLIEPDENHGKIVLSFHRAATTAGMLDAESVKFHPTTVDGESLLIARGMDRDVDGRSHIHSRSLVSVIAKSDNGTETRTGTRATVPPQDFEAAFGLSREDLAARDATGNAPKLQVLAAPDERVVVFRQASELSLDREVVPDVVE